jgi:hypothetical protein
MPYRNWVNVVAALMVSYATSTAVYNIVAIRSDTTSTVIWVMESVQVDVEDV